MKIIDKRKLTNILLVSTLLAVLAAIYILIPAFAIQVNTGVSILSKADIEGMRAYLNDFGIWAPMVSMALMVLQALASPLPAFVITFANAWIFGWVLGAFYSWTGAMIGAAVCYWIAKVYGRPVVEKLVGKTSLEKTDNFFARYGKHSVMIARLIPVVPFDIVSYAAGLTQITFWEFFWATGIGQLPATIVYSWLGQNMSPTAKYALWAVCGFLVLLIFSIAVKQRLQDQLGKGQDIKKGA